MDRALTSELRARLAVDGGGGFVAARAVDPTAMAGLANELGARHAVLDAPTGKRALIAALAAGLGLHPASGRDWDAIEEMLAYPDPSLAPDGPVILTWLSPDRLDPADAATFRSILDAAIAARAADGGGPLLVVAGPPLAAADDPRPPGAVPPAIRSLGKVHHVALIVASIEASLTLWRDVLGLPLQTIMDIPDDRVRIAFLDVGESKVELVEPTDDTTGVARFLASKGEGFHHVCFEVPDLAETLLRLEIDGLELIDHAPRRGAEGPVAFLHPRAGHGVLIELIEAPGGPAWRSLGFTTPS